MKTTTKSKKNKKGKKAFDPEPEKEKFSIEDGVNRELMWVTYSDSCAYVRTMDGRLHEGWDFLIDKDGDVYMYDPILDGSYPVTGAQAYTAQGTPLRFDEDFADIELVFPALPF